MDIVSPESISDLTRLVLVDAIYFKGKWASVFDPKRTRDAQFHLDQQRSIKVPMMWQKGDYSYGSIEDLEAVELTYSGNELAMVFILPNSKADLDKLDARLDSELLNKVVSNLKKRKLIVRLPRFRFDREIELSRPLQDLGLTTAFSASTADFSNMHNKSV